MSIRDLEKLLLQTFEDLKLSDSEKYVLKEVFNDFSYNIEKLNFIRNKGFEIIKSHISEKKINELEAIKWLEKLLKIVDSVKNNNLIDSPEVYFSPGEECANRIKQLLRNAEKEILICVFTISDNLISEEIVAAHERGIDVKIVTDNDKIDDRGSDVKSLSSKGISVKLDITKYHMHHKFAIIDQSILINGSFNWTRSASKYNEENVVVHYDKSLINKFNNTFSHLWRECKKL
ncbi:MAG: hypothetical protein COA79_23890 [Planctomycetota bacterium]|nr:MAG: hypothetical protein COA79_23890 [Planctomycetota bacterium]